MLIKSVLEQKPRHGVMTIEATKTVQTAIQKMCDEKVGALLIHSEKGETVGILTERDILRFSAQRTMELGEVPISAVMTKNPVVVTPETTLDQAQSIMTENRFRHLPVVEQGKIVGLVSIGDLVKAKLTETAGEVKHLLDYITYA